MALQHLRATCLGKTKKWAATIALTFNKYNSSIFASESSDIFEEDENKVQALDLPVTTLQQNKI